MKTLTAAKADELVESFYSESNSDLVGLWEIAKEVESFIGIGDAARKQSLDIVRALLKKGLLAGDPPYCMNGYVPWSDQNPDSVVDKVDREWLKLGHTPSIPDIVWFGRPL